MSEFIDLLHEKFQAKLQKSATHPLTNELCQGTLPDYKLYTYLVQDLKFFQLGLHLFGNVIRLCDDEKATVFLGKQVGVFCGNENTYFFETMRQLRASSLKQLESHVPSMLLESPPVLPAVDRYLNMMKVLTYGDLKYEDLICFIYVMEKVYLDWANYNREVNDISGLAYKHKEWIDLHSGTAFEDWVELLRKELNRVAENPATQARIEKWFEMTIDLEIEFFEECYTFKE